MNTQFGCVAIFLAVFYLVGFGLLGYGLRCAQLSVRAASWPKAEGVVKHIALHEDKDSEGTTYHVNVQYSYTVDGVSYDGDRVAFGYAATSGRKMHEQLHERLAGAKTVQVRYDPANPAESCLSFGLHRSIQFLLAFSITWLLFVIGFTVIAWLATHSDAVLLDNLTVQ